MRYGLIGEKLGHSHSARLHALLGDADYELHPLPPEALDAFLETRAFEGVNVTIPYKRAVMAYCAQLSDTARAIGSVNTLIRRADGTLYGDNTDAFGFAKLAEEAGIDFAGRKALVLGSGGTSLTACYVIREAGGTPVVISRSGDNDYAHLEAHADAAIIVNATPAGMYPRVDDTLLDLTHFPALRGVVDVVYNPLRTRLMQQAEALGIPCTGGLGMLVWQAVRARELFDGHPVDELGIREAAATLRRTVSNLVLVGMPGSGKTTVARRCARQLSLPLVDVDAEIERHAGKPIEQLFAQEGEAVFRTWEAEVIAQVGACGGQVIATGGGAVLREDNRRHLRMNGVVGRLERPLENLSTQGRPLSKGLEALRRMAGERDALYAACADVTVPNTGTLEACVQQVLEGYDEILHH